jgi:hypothetical protein
MDTTIIDLSARRAAVATRAAAAQAAFKPAAGQADVIDALANLTKHLASVVSGLESTVKVQSIQIGLLSQAVRMLSTTNLNPTQEISDVP